MAVFSVVLFCCVLLNDFADGVVQNSDDENKLGVKSQGAFRTGSESRDAFRSASGRRDAVKTGSERQNAGRKSKASSPLHLDGKSFGAYHVCTNSSVRPSVTHLFQELSSIPARCCLSGNDVRPDSRAL